MFAQKLLDNLENLRLVTLEHSKLQLEKEFIILDYIMGEGSAAITAQVKFGKTAID